MTDLRTAPYAAFLFRLSLGIMFLAHAAVKLFIFTPSGTAGYFSSLGLPPALAYLVMAAEVIGGLALIFGVYTRAVALLLTPVLLGAIATVHGANGWLFTNTGGGWVFGDQEARLVNHSKTPKRCRTERVAVVAAQTATDRRHDRSVLAEAPAVGAQQIRQGVAQAIVAGEVGHGSRASMRLDIGRRGAHHRAARC